MARIRRALEKVAVGDESLASASRKLGYASNYLQTRGRRNPEIRELMDHALIERAELWLDDAATIGAGLQQQIIDVVLEAGKEDGEPVTPADIDRLSRSLVNITEVLERTAAAARQRDDARAGRGDSAGELFAALAARWGPATSPAQLEGETA